ncbi:c-type cytochrome [Rhodopirellula sp. JC737]|nr:c-type cytochrome [Rhodopirellula sp. JC737]
MKTACMSATALVLVLVAFTNQCCNGQEDFADELPRIPPTPAEQTLSRFEIADGYKMELVASEPLVTSPVAIEWAADGSLFVCEMRGYSEDRERGISRITHLWDDDQDGTYDRSIVFADGLMWPTGLFPWKDGLFVGDAPHLYFFRDADGDGVADEKRIVLTGFGTSNVQGLLNSFRWGLDGRIHIATSSTGGQVRDPDKPAESAVNVRGRDIALDPRSETFELTSGAAQHGMCFDDWGRKYVSSNSDHLQQVMYEEEDIARNPWMQPAPARISIAEDGPQAPVYRTSPVEPWRIVRTRLRVSGQVGGPIEGGGRAAGYFTGATGVTILRGDAWSDKDRGLSIIGDVGSNLIHRKRLDADGIARIGRRIDDQTEWATSDDIWFRPAQFANAPDGSLHVIDVCREVIEHPKSLPPDLKKHLDLTSGRDRGRLYRLAPTNHRDRPTPNLSQMTDVELVSLLSHPNAWHRETASRLLVERDTTEASALQELGRQSDSALGRLHAISVLFALDALRPEIILERFQDQHPAVRRFAIRMAKHFPRNSQLGLALQRMTADPSIEVRYQLAFTLGWMESQDTTDSLIEILLQNPTDRWIQTAVQSSIADDGGKVLAKLLSKQNRTVPSEFLQRIVEQVLQRNEPSEVAKMVQTLEALDGDDAGFAMSALGRVLQSRNDKQHSVYQLDQSNQLANLDKQIRRLAHDAVAIALDEDASLNTRIAAIESLQFADRESVQPIAELISAEHPVGLQRSAMRTLGAFADAEIGQTLVEQWSTLSPQLRETAAEIMFARPSRTLLLLSAIDDERIALSEVSRTRLQVAATSQNDSIRELASRLLKRSGNQNRGAVLKAYQKSLSMDGRVDRGRGLFRKHCANCHRVEGVGHELGPNLATVRSRGPAFILTNVLDPNREVNPEFLNYAAIDLDGRTYSGVIANETAASITLQRAESAKDSLLRTNLEQLKSTGQSIMPEGLEQQLSPQAMADLIAYLMQVE